MKMKKIKKFLFDIGYDIGKGYKRSSRYRTIERILEVKEKNFGRGLIEDKLDNHSCNFADNLIDTLEFFILETKAGYDMMHYMMKC